MAKLEASCPLLTFVGRMYTELLARSNVLTICNTICLQHLPSTPALQPLATQQRVEENTRVELKAVETIWLLLYLAYKISLAAECWWHYLLYVLRNFDQVFTL